jgi:hypothetical protein
MDKIRAAVVATSFTLFLGAVGTIGVLHNKKSGAEKAKEERIAQIVSQFKACPERFKTVRGCLSAEDRVKRIGDAVQAREKGEFQKAGIIFAEILQENDAREMAGKCQQSGNTEGRERILTVLSERQEAAERAAAELSQ